MQYKDRTGTEMLEYVLFTENTPLIALLWLTPFFAILGCREQPSVEHGADDILHLAGLGGWRSMICYSRRMVISLPGLWS